MVVFLISFLCSAILTGLIWTIQLVHYPLFKLVGPDKFQEYEHAHTSRISILVMPIMLIELGTSVVMIFGNPLLTSLQTYISLGFVLIVWLSTFTLQAPTHRKLGSGIDTALIDYLVHTNWIRTIAWTGRTLFLTLLISQML